MEIFGREWCHAYVWTVNGSALWTFRRDRQYWAAVYEVRAMVLSSLRITCAP